MKLYEIRDDLLETLDLLTEIGEDELATENCMEMFQFLKEELKKKGDGILKYIRNLESEKQQVAEEVDRLEQIKKKKEGKLAFLKKYLVNIMLELEEKKIETDIGSYGIRKSSRVEVTDIEKLPLDFVKTKEEKVVDKVALGKYLKTALVEGAKLVEHYSFQIK